MELIKGIQGEAIKLVAYGPEGIGKSTFASCFPRPVFIDTEGSTARMDVVRTPKPHSWTELLQQVKYFIQHPDQLGTLIIDTADWAERLCSEQICAANHMDSIEGASYGRGYVYLAEEFGRLLNVLDELRHKGIHIILTAHATMRKFEQPDEMGAYDRWELKLQKKTAPMVKEWADAIFFINYKTIVVNVDNQGTAKGKNKAQGGRRVMYTTHHPCWDAKNRFGLPDEMPFEYGKIAHLFEAPSKPAAAPKSAPPPEPPTTTPPPPKPASPPPEPWIGDIPDEPKSPEPEPDIPPALLALMNENGVKACEIQYAVSQRGYYPGATPIANYDPDFVKGVLIGAWPQVLSMVMKNREDTPF